MKIQVRRWGLTKYKKKTSGKKNKKEDYFDLITKVTKRFLTQFDRSHFASCELLSKILDKRDSYTHNHSRNVAKYSIAVSERMGLSSKDKDIVRYASLLHDVGKMGIDMSILQKKGRLTRIEWEEIRVHTHLGAEIVAKVKQLTDIASTVLHHHERFGGGGYPNPDMKNNDIPLTARIVACADAYDAMRSNRSYRKAMPRKKALDELVSCSGTQFDPEIVKVLLQVIDEEEHDTKGYDL